MNTFFNGLRKVETFFTCLFMAAFAIVASAQVVFRVFLNNPLAWSEEASIFLFIWSVFLGAALVYAHNAHFRVDFFVMLFPPKAQVALKYFSWALAVAFSIILIRFGYQLMLVNLTRVSPALGISQAYIYIVIPLNGILVILHVIEQIWRHWTEPKTEEVAGS